MEPIKTFNGQFVALPINDTDTDQIIPARFLKVTDKLGLGAGAVLRLALQRRRIAQAGFRAQPAGISGRVDPDRRA